MPKSGQKTFVRITNEDIYNKLEDMDKKLVAVNNKVQEHDRQLSLIQRVVAAIGITFLGGVVTLIVDWLKK